MSCRFIFDLMSTLGKLLTRSPPTHQNNAHCTNMHTAIQAFWPLVINQGESWTYQGVNKYLLYQLNLLQNCIVLFVISKTVNKNILNVKISHTCYEYIRIKPKYFHPPILILFLFNLNQMIFLANYVALLTIFDLTFEFGNR